ncbi:hypothetical protein BDB01DRAFT_854356 [Pilobolus umbonatus]|nr:hypothetical protein BDB01DRAFT_854356 [Pilobolus umbonatus]
MNTLPNEILENVVKDLKKKDFLTCLTVNKCFYSTFIKYLYRDVYLPDEDRATLFINSLQHYSRNKEAGRYVTSLCADDNIEFNELITELWAFDMLTYFPNIEELAIEASLDLVCSLINTTEPVLTRIKKIHFSRQRCSRDYISDCYLKFRSTLTYLQFVYGYSIPPNFLVEESISYLTAFPHLTDLHIEISFSQLCSTFLFTDALKACPSLTSLYYECRTLNFNQLHLEETQTFPHLRNFTIITRSFTVNDAHIIKHSLPQLEFFSLEFHNKIEDEYHTMDTLLQMKIPNTLKISPHEPFNRSTCANILNYLGHWVKEKAEAVVLNTAIFLHDPKSNALLQEYDPLNNLRTITTSLHHKFKSPQYRNFLDQIGRNLTILEWADFHRTSWNLEDFNQRCSRLTELKLYSTRLNSYDGTFTVNNHLTSLTIKDCTLNALLLKRLSTCFPNLEELCFFQRNWLIDKDYVSLDDPYHDPYDDEDSVYDYYTDDNADNDAVINNQIHYIHLDVHTLTIKQDFPYMSWDIMVIKAVDDVWVKSWSYNTVSKRIVTSEDKDKINDIQPLENLPLFVFICDAIETVSIQFEEISNCILWE